MIDIPVYAYETASLLFINILCYNLLYQGGIIYAGDKQILWNYYQNDL